MKYYKIFNKSLLIFISIMVPILLLGAILVHEIRKAKENISFLRINTIPAIELLGMINAEVDLFRAQEIERLYAQTTKEKETIDSELLIHLKNIEFMQKRYAKFYIAENISTSNDNNLSKELNEYYAAHAVLMQMLQNGDTSDAKKSALMGIKKEFAEVSVEIHRMINLHKKYATEINNRIMHNESVTHKITFILFFLSIIIGVLTAYFYKEIEKRNKKLSQQLYHDPLTGLPNRKSLLEKLEKISGDNILVVLNIDRFRELNDFYGEAIGDEILLWLSGQLQKYREDGVYDLFRMPSDEFVLLAEQADSNAFIQTIASLLFDELSICHIEKHDIFIQFTFGIAIGKGLELLKNAYIAMNQAKQKRQLFLVYDTKMDPIIHYRENSEWAKKIAKALAEDRILVYFQPIINNVSGRIDKYEALVRMQLEDGTVISPYNFLDIAKQGRLYPQITQTVVKKSLESFQDRDESISINLSFEDIADEHINRFILSMLDQYQMKERVVFEILESEGIDNFETVAYFIQSVKKRGAKVAIDDFGSGYSNFDTILKLNIDILKIDGSLIKIIDKDPYAQKIVTAIIQFAKELGLETIAEFVHNADIREEVVRIGVHYSQGFFFSEPVSLECLNGMPL